MHASVRNIEGNEVLSKDYSADELKLRDEKHGIVQGTKLCLARSERQLSFRLLVDKVRLLAFENDTGVFLRLIVVVPLSIVLSLAIMLRVASFLLKIFKG